MINALSRNKRVFMTKSRKAKLGCSEIGWLTQEDWRNRIGDACVADGGGNERYDKDRCHLVVMLNGRWVADGIG